MRIKILSYSILLTLLLVGCSGRDGKSSSRTDSDGRDKEYEQMATEDSATAGVVTPDSRPTTKVRFATNWYPQAQFAGYYVALAKGFYTDEGLDVDITDAPDCSGSVYDMLESGEIAFGTEYLLGSIIRRDKGAKIVNILQTSQNCGLILASHSPIDEKQLKNLTLGRWTTGYTETADLYFFEHDINTQLINHNAGIEVFIAGAEDVMLCYSFSEFLQLRVATGGIPEENTLKFSDLGYNFPEDGLYTSEKFAKKNPEVVNSFVRASVRGWDYAREHREEALEIVMDFTRKANVATNLTFQRMQLDEILRLQVDKGSDLPDYSPISEETYGHICSSMMYAGMLINQPDYNEFIKWPNINR